MKPILLSALALALVLGGWLARSVLRPIHELQRGMGRVAEGDFEPDLRIPLDRSDELGDLGRSFRWMAEQLSELERLRAEFVSVASHELKTPLSVIKGYVSLLEDGIYGEVPEEQQKVLGAIGGAEVRGARCDRRCWVLRGVHPARSTQNRRWHPAPSTQHPEPLIAPSTKHPAPRTLTASPPPSPPLRRRSGNDRPGSGVGARST